MTLERQRNGNLGMGVGMKSTVARPRLDESKRLNCPLRCYTTKATQDEIDRLVMAGTYKSRSDLISTAIDQLINKKPLDSGTG